MDPKHSLGPDRIDYHEAPGDLTEVHAAIQREHPEPTAEVTPIPLWLTGVCGLAILWAGLYLGLFHGGFRSDVFNERLSSPDLLFPHAAKGGGPATAAAPESLAQQGKNVYANCQPCHQATGTGIAGQFPPLAKSEWVNAGEKRIVAILLKGLTGPIAVNGATVNGAMPAWEKTLSDQKIAAVASFVRSSFGNTSPEISAAKVAAARVEFASKTDNWTAAQLEKIPADATLPDAAGAAPAAGAPGSAPAAAAPGGAAPTSGSPAPAPAGGAPAPAPGAPPAASAGGPPDPALLAQGKAQYMAICFACHQPTGLGLPMVFPPLAKSPYVNGSPERFVAMILKGNMGPMTIEGKPYNNVMPPQEALLTDEKVAAVATYVRNSFGNSAPAVTKEIVAATRQKFADRKTSWTQPELDAWKE